VLVDSIMMSLGVGVAVVDRELLVQMWNDRCRELWGLGAADVRDQHFLNLDIGLPVQQLRDPLRACLAGASDGEERRLEARDRRGRDIICRVRIAPLAAPDGDMAGAILLMESD
jgi:two-component system CheB/CheR fusion protein